MATCMVPIIMICNIFYLKKNHEVIVSTDMNIETKSSSPTKFLELGKVRQADSFSVVNTESWSF